MSFDDPTEAAKGFKRLIQKLRKTEGQDLAFLRLARLTEKPRDRRRIIRNLALHRRLICYRRIDGSVHQQAPDDETYSMHTRSRSGVDIDDRILGKHPAPRSVS